MRNKITRRDFIKGMAAAGAGIYGLQLASHLPAASNSPSNQLSVAQGDLAKEADPEMIKKVTKQAISNLGGMGKFVKKGSVVMVKPNIGWNNIPERAANTNPYVVAAVVEMCLEAGAKKVRVLDYTINPPKITYSRSGIEEAVKRAKGSMEYIDDRKFKTKNIPKGQEIKSWSIYQDALDVDLLINLPIAKHHSLTRLSLGMKNLMGLIQKREELHTRIDQKLADLSTEIKPGLIIIDAYRVLTANGPNAGTEKDIKLMGQVIAGTDPVAVDSYTATLFGYKGEDIGYIRAGNTMGLGEIDLSKVKMIKTSVT